MHHTDAHCIKLTRIVTTFNNKTYIHIFKYKQRIRTWIASNSNPKVFPILGADMLDLQTSEYTNTH